MAPQTVSLLIFGLGYCGRRLAEHLISSPPVDTVWQITATVRNTDKACPIAGVRLLPFDSRDPTPPSEEIRHAVSTATHILITAAPDMALEKDPVLARLESELAARSESSSPPVWVGYDHASAPRVL